MTILPLTYLGPLAWFARLLDGECVVDTGEYFCKRTYRNRCEILAANGVITLSVPVCRANRPQQPMRQMRLDYSKRWMHEHWTSIRSAYGGAPYFAHYADRLAPLYARRAVWLVEWDWALLEFVAGALRLPLPAISEQWIDAGHGDCDLRGRCAPCTRPDAARTVGDRPAACGTALEGDGETGYVQVFADRYPFVPNLSILDLLFCEGPAAVRWLAASGLR